MIDQHYAGDPETKKLENGALDGMLKSLDSFSEFLSAREFQEIKNEVNGEYGGVGIVVALRGDYPKVIKVLKGSPAEEMGILEFDEIVKIENVSTYRLPIFNIIEKLRGPLGSEVSVTLKRGMTAGDIQIKLKREKIVIESIREKRFIAPNVGYVRLVEFIQNTKLDLENALQELKKNGAKILILDLRNNMGGTLDSAVDISRVFIPSGKLIVKTKGRDPENTGSFFADENGSETVLPLFVLINRYTASASEIVAGALKDNGRAKIVGEKSFGKGSVQTLFPLKDGSAIRLTTAYYETPKGERIDQKGIQPDVELAFPDEIEQMKEMADKRDSILDKTLEIVNGQKTQK